LKGREPSSTLSDYRATPIPSPPLEGEGAKFLLPEEGGIYLKNI